MCAGALIPAILLGAQFSERVAARQRTGGGSPDSLFKRAGIRKAKTATACEAALDSASNSAYMQVEADINMLPADARDTASYREYAAITANKKAAAATCARRFKLATADSSDLHALVGLYDNAGMDPQLQAALDRHIALATSTEAKAEALLDAVGHYATYDTTPGRTARAEPYVAQLDALGDSAQGERVEAHAMVSGSRKFYDAADPLARSQALSLARALPPEDRTKTYHQGHGAYVAGLTAAAEEDASNGDYKTALAILNEGIANMGDTSKSYEVKGMLSSFRRYALVGTPAPAVTPEHWINAPDGTTTLPYQGHVTMLEFTTTWCHWCKKGYPAMRRLAAKYQSHGYQPMFVSLIEGKGMNKPDTIDAELAYDRKHWVEGDSITFPIAIYDTKFVIVPPSKNDFASKPDSVAGKPLRVPKDSTGDSTRAAAPQRREEPIVFKEYLADGYPTYYFIDKNGIIRDIQVGHREDLEQRFAGIIERLLAEAGRDALDGRSGAPPGP
jgi:thiol-disulfide isomerase/thioredoxin